MSTHFGDIGFRVEKQEDIGRLFLDLIPKSKKQEFGEHLSYLTSDESGARLYWSTKKAKLFKKEEFIGVTPGFKGLISQKIRDPKFMPNKEWPLEPSLSLWITDNDTNEEYPLIVDIANYQEVQTKDFASMQDIHAILFANSFEYFTDEAEFFVKYPKGEKVSIPAPGMFIPTGTFSPKEDPNFIPKAVCWCYGRVKEFNKLKNKLTNQEFYHFVMQTYAAEYDVVVEIKDVVNEPKINAIIGGEFWVSAIIN